MNKQTSKVITFLLLCLTISAPTDAMLRNVHRLVGTRITRLANTRTLKTVARLTPKAQPHSGVRRSQLLAGTTTNTSRFRPVIMAAISRPFSTTDALQKENRIVPYETLTTKRDLVSVFEENTVDEFIDVERIKAGFASFVQYLQQNEFETKYIKRFNNFFKKLTPAQQAIYVECADQHFYELAALDCGHELLTGMVTRNKDALGVFTPKLQAMVYNDPTEFTVINLARELLNANKDLGKHLAPIVAEKLMEMLESGRGWLVNDVAKSSKEAADILAPIVAQDIMTHVITEGDCFLMYYLAATSTKAAEILASASAENILDLINEKAGCFFLHQLVQKSAVARKLLKPLVTEHKSEILSSQDKNWARHLINIC